MPSPARRLDSATRISLPLTCNGEKTAAELRTAACPNTQIRGIRMRLRHRHGLRGRHSTSILGRSIHPRAGTLIRARAGATPISPLASNVHGYSYQGCRSIEEASLTCQDASGIAAAKHPGAGTA